MAPHKIPKDDFVYQVVRDVVRKRGIVDTQEELCYLVIKRLKKYNPEFVLSANRVKKIAIKIPEIKIKAKTKKTEHTCQASLYPKLSAKIAINTAPTAICPMFEREL